MAKTMFDPLVRTDYFVSIITHISMATSTAYSLSATCQVHSPIIHRRHPKEVDGTISMFMRRFFEQRFIVQFSYTPLTLFLMFWFMFLLAGSACNTWPLGCLFRFRRSEFKAYFSNRNGRIRNSTVIHSWWTHSALICAPTTALIQAWNTLATIGRWYTSLLGVCFLWNTWLSLL